MGDRDDAVWRIEVLGGLRLVGRGQAITHFETRRVAARLAYLALYPERTHSREVVMERLWPEEDPEATRVRLRTVLASLRRVLEPPGTAAGSVLIADRVTVQLRPAAVAVDVAEFDTALRGAASAPSPRERA